MLRITSLHSHSKRRGQNVAVTMAGTDTPAAPNPLWESDSVTLKNFSSKGTVPTFAKVTKGSYMNIGHSKFSIQRQHTEIYVHSIKMGVKVLAHSVRRIEGTTRRGYPCCRLVAMDQRLAIPISYQGWFELLSEDGKSARPITSVHELAKAFPNKCLVRENVKGYLSTSDGKLTFDKTRVVTAGERLILCGDITLPSPQHNKKVKMLKCYDSKDENIYLSFDQKGIFTPVAGPDDLLGVLSIRDIVRKFRLPLTVKLVQGVKPKVDPSKFTGLIRMDWVYTDETAFVCPLEKNHIRILPVPTDTNLQLAMASNHLDLKKSEMFRNLSIKCNRMISNYNNTIHLIVTLPESLIKNKGKNRTSSNIFSKPLQMEESRPMRRSKSREDLLMDEIDDLYQFVRDGGVPPQKSKFTYDSDEESYWEEPAYEPLNDFRARLVALEAGKQVIHHVKYKPADPRKLGLDIEQEVGPSQDNVYGVLTNGGAAVAASPRVNPPAALPEPPIQIPVEPEKAPPPSESTPPPLPPRQYVRTDPNPAILASSPGDGNSQHSSGSGDKKKKTKEKRRSLRNLQRSPDTSSGSSGSRGMYKLGKDFKDSDISSRTRDSSESGSGSKNVRRRMKTLYL
ncbi:uncharacterized protein LOC121375763 [Gigantopelta aegis]|uniref:uncharacterized protein LOC121375763 n=1 Tax=Gigantopelta aegis TaxID=1735272 RepID=UPI001B88B8E3|nr:uncharacterized protein LOC121375763 [Gigantopelta aegis]